MNTGLTLPVLTGHCRVVLAAMLLALAVPLVSAGQAGAKAPDRAALFQAHSRLTLRLEAPFGELLRARGEKRPYFPAVLVHTDTDGAEHKLELKVRVRGNFRAKKENCRFPPLKLNFRKKSTAGTVFEGQDKLKLVTHCQNDSKYEQFVMLEYMAYRMQNLLTDYSLRPRLATVEYYDSERQRVEKTKPGFIIEDKGQMAERLGAVLAKQPRIEFTQYRQDDLHFATIFEYLLGNTDYSVILGPKGEDCCHNIIPLQLPDTRFVPVPYDFDVTGLVNPPYAAPPEHLGIRSLRQRLYRGFCQNTAGFKQSFARFEEKKEAIYTLFQTTDGLQEKTVRSALRYLDNFYEDIAEDEKIVSRFIEKCRKK